MEASPPISSHGSNLYQRWKSAASRISIAIWPLLAIVPMAAALDALSSCGVIQGRRTGVLVIPPCMGLARDNGARPQIVTDTADLDSYPDFAIVLVDQDGGRNEHTLSAHEYFQAFPDDWRLAFHGLQPTKSASTARMLLAGSVFLDHYYVVFDYTTDPVRIGIADRVDP